MWFTVAVALALTFVAGLVSVRRVVVGDISTSAMLLFWVVALVGWFIAGYAVFQ